jgi:uncharacterized protein YdhG (YjbR/CyaY superfamily)
MTTAIDAYLAGLPAESRAALEEVRRQIRTIAPDAEELISYGVPTLKYRGRPLAYFGAARQHLALYGFSVDEYREELAAFDTSKGTIRFQPDHLVPEPLLRKMLSARMATIDAAEAKRRQPRAKTAAPD